MRSERVRLRMEMEKAGKKEIVVAVSPEREREKERAREREHGVVDEDPRWIPRDLFSSYSSTCMLACMFARKVVSEPKGRGASVLPSRTVKSLPEPPKAFPQLREEFLVFFSLCRWMLTPKLLPMAQAYSH